MFPIFSDNQRIRIPGCPSPFHQAWHALGNSHAITTLHIRFIPAVPFLSLLRAFPFLKKLHIEQCQLLWQEEPYSYRPKSIRDRCARPREFLVDESFAQLCKEAGGYAKLGLEDMGGSLKTFLRNLEILEVHVFRCHSEHHAKVFDLCQGSLKTLTMYVFFSAD